MTESTGEFFASCARGLEGFLAAELSEIGVPDARQARSGARFGGDMAAAMRA